MDVPELDASLSTQLTAEFGEHGKRAVDSLVTAQKLLGLEPGLLPRHGAMVAYCLRDALVEIPKASGVGDEGRRNTLSKAVVESAGQYRGAVGSLDDHAKIARQAMFSHIDDLQKFLDQPSSVHQDRIKELFRQRSGAEPLSAGTAPLHAYERLRQDCGRAGHQDCTIDAARRLWTECLELLRRLFLAHDRGPEALERLACLEAPDDADFEDLMDRAVTPVDLESFLHHIQSPNWLWRLAHSDALQAPGGRLWWAACTAAIRLNDAHRDQVTQWVEEMHAQHADSAEQVRCFAYAARRIGDDSLDLLLRIVRRHPTDERVAIEGLNCALDLDAAHPMVVDLADILLNEHSWDQIHIADRLAAHVVDGIDADNSLDRINRICLKLRNSANDTAISIHRTIPSGTIDGAHEVFPHDRASVLLGCVTRMLRAAWDWHPASSLLECVDRLPDAVRVRVRAWILGSAADVDPETLVAEVSMAISTRDATGDDDALVKRALDVCNGDEMKRAWRDALGDAPDVGFVQRAVNGEETLPESLWRARSWLPLLPEAFAAMWAAPCQVLSDVMGEVSREHLLTRSLPRMREIGSPMDAQYFAAMSPMDAAAAIVEWRPGSSDFYVSARGLGKVLQGLITEDPASWLADPVGIATTLHHPTYISAYLRAVENLEDRSALEPVRLLEVIKLVATEPWQAAPIGRNGHRYEPDWIETRRAAVELIGTITASGVSFGDRADEAWGHIESAARREPRSGGALVGNDQTVRTEISLSARALELAVQFVDAEIKASKPLRSQFEQLLDYSLRLEGDLGLEHREVLASNILWLRRWLPEWTASAMERLIGSEAPDGLGATTFEWMLRLNRPSQWLCEGYAEMLCDAAKRRQEPAMTHLLLAMLWGWKGYSVEAVARFLERHAELIYEAAEQLARLLRHDDVDADHLGVGVRLWEELLRSTAVSSVAGFGWMSIAIALDDALWSELTRKTLDATRGQFGWDEEVANRAMTEPLTADKFAILDLLMRHTPSDWVRRRIADNADKLLRVGSDLAQTDEHVRLRTALISHGLVATG